MAHFLAELTAGAIGGLFVCGAWLSYEWAMIKVRS